VPDPSWPATGSVKAIASYPTFNNGTHHNGTIEAAANEINPDSGAAVALNGGTSPSMGNTATAYAICTGTGINVSNITVTV
jgi:hypothetical protein